MQEVSFMSIMHFSRYRPLAATLAVLMLAGCTKWSGASDPVDQYVRAEEPYEVRLTLTDGRVVPLWDVEMVGDTIVGFTERPSKGISQRERQQRAGYPLDEVARLEQHKTDAVLTIVGVAVIVGVLLGVLFAASGCSGDSYAC
jgi:hypothetical protein